LILKPAKIIIDRFPRIASAYRHMRDTWRLFDDPKVVPSLGFKLIGHDDMEAGKYEKDEFAAIGKILSDIDIFIDIGANIGYYSLLALKHKKKVIAFEPIELNLKFLYKNVVANGWQDNIEIYPVALGGGIHFRECLIPIYGDQSWASLIKGFSGTPEWVKRYVPITKLDNLAIKRFEGKRLLIKVDAEGSENMILDGATKLFTLIPRPIWFIETIKDADYKSIFRKFWQYGYSSKTVNQKYTFKSYDIDCVEKYMQKQESFSSSFNFLFY